MTKAQFTALYGPGGAVDPTTGESLVRTRRPGMELVIAAHKTSHASICQAARSSAFVSLGFWAGQATASL